MPSLQPASVYIFLLKLLLAPVLIFGVSLVERRWGPAISGWVVGLPMASAPIVFILALEQGTGFASDAARSAILGLASVSSFGITYSATARRLGWLGSLLAGWGGFFASTTLLGTIRQPPLLLSYVAVVGYVALIFNLIPRAPRTAGGTAGPRGEIPMRMVAATSMVFLITGIAPYLGPQLSGLVTPFPVFTSVLALFLHRIHGPAAAVELVRGVVLGSLTYATFFLVVAYGMLPWGLLPAFGGGIAVGAVVHSFSVRLVRRA